jgi:hypothetical protein
VLFGYGTLSEAEIDEGLQVIAAAMAAVRAGREQPRAASA